MPFNSTYWFNNKISTKLLFSHTQIHGLYRTYSCGEGIESFTGADKGKLTFERSRLIDEGGNIVCDPSVITMPDGSYLMFYKVQEISDEPKESEKEEL